MSLKQKIKEIESLLNNEWKPLWDNVPEGEYSSYTLKICSYLEKWASEEDIKNLLLSFQQEDMGLRRDEKHIQKVVQKIKKSWNNL